MLGLVIALVLCVALGSAVVAVVAMPARREGRDLLGPQGEAVLERVKGVASATKERTGGLLGHDDVLSDEAADGRSTEEPGLAEDGPSAGGGAAEGADAVDARHPASTAARSSDPA